MYNNTHKLIPCLYFEPELSLKQFFVILCIATGSMKCRTVEKSIRILLRTVLSNYVGNIMYLFDAKTWEKMSAESLDSVSAVCKNINDALYYMINTLK